MKETLTIDHEMILRTLRLSKQPLSVATVTAQWSPTWTPKEVEVLLGDLVSWGKVQMQGKDRRMYAISGGSDKSARE